MTSVGVFVCATTLTLAVVSVMKGAAMSESEVETPRHIVIGVHGLLNKPAKQVLEVWWADAIKEGLRHNHDIELPLPFELVYWADIRNTTPIALEDLDERYQEATAPLSRYDPKGIDKARAVAQKWGGRMLDKEKELIGLGRNVEGLLGVKFDDLGAYYEEALIRQRMRSRLTDALQRHQDKRILLIAHSMGSIIAYDVMRQLEDDGAVEVEYLVTIGSPLGLPIVADKIRQEFGATQTPSSVQRWTNLADPGDKVSLDCNLADEYDPANDIQVTDVLVHNQYVNHNGKANNHKSYGYLRAPEVSQLIRNFLQPL